MQSLYGKLRVVARQTIGNLKTVESIAPFESNLSRHALSRSSAFISDHFGSCSLFRLNQNLHTRTVEPTYSGSYGVPSALSSQATSSSLNHSASMVFKLLSRNMTTEAASQDVSPSPAVPERIKFKRLDKTARHIMQIIDKEAVEDVKTSREIPEIKPGYIVQLKVEVPENRRRTSMLKGVVIARRNAGLNTTFRIRRLVAGVGIENVFHLYSPNIKKIKVLDKKKVRRAKLYYLRDKMNALKRQ
ncbi:50S ribosomal protein L19-2, chloroplastic-like [Andrographis paniculata]|uniref:50S ribosomal protein L19-2, chloroplastic-like n=1 Tax=Andrographis paniculata TaxID=175694 RepID=UPI0021E8A334|nr:50S ribosomal protein L19-2, chloroplastic-like [Andrographis paniculata]